MIVTISQCAWRGILILGGRKLTSGEGRAGRLQFGLLWLVVGWTGLWIGCNRSVPPAAAPPDRTATRTPAAEVRAESPQTPAPVGPRSGSTPAPDRESGGQPTTGRNDLGREATARIDVTDWNTLRERVGQRVTVYGKISRATKSRAGDEFLNFAGSDLKLVCFRSDQRQFTDGTPVDRFADQDVEVSGLLELYQGRPQIRLKVPEQIRADGPADGPAERVSRSSPNGAGDPERSQKVGSATGGLELQKIGEDEWLSPAGLVYRGRDAEGRTRLEHVMRHAADEPQRVGSHGVFEGGRDGALAVIDEAWERIRRLKIRPQRDEGREAYLVSMGRRIGYLGGQAGQDRGNPPLNRVRLVVREGTSEVVTAYPD